MGRKTINRALNRRIVYVGPTLRRGLLKAFTVFRDGEYPAPIAKMREKSPALRGLFVPVTDLAEARRRVATKGDLLHAYVARLNQELKEE